MLDHYEYSETLDRLRDDYYYFNPEIAGHTAADRAKRDCAYDDLIRSLDKVLKDANFEELPHEEVTEAHRKRTVPVEVKADHDDFREVRFYKRGQQQCRSNNANVAPKKTFERPKALNRCPFVGVKRTSHKPRRMSASDPLQTSADRIFCRAN